MVLNDFIYVDIDPLMSVFGNIIIRSLSLS